MRIRKPPRARPAAAGFSLVLALLLIGVAVVSVRDLAVDQGWTGGTGWTASVVEGLDGLTATTGLVAGGVAAAIVGLLLVLVALKPAPVSHLRADAGVSGGSDASSGDLWLSSAAVAALARTVADRSPGVISAEVVRTGARRIVVEVVTSQDSETVIDRVERALGTRVQGLTRATVTVRAREVTR